MKEKIIEWIKANPWKVAVIALSILVIASGSVSYGCGYVKGCSAQKSKVEAN